MPCGLSVPHFLGQTAANQASSPRGSSTQGVATQLHFSSCLSSRVVGNRATVCRRERTALAQRLSYWWAFTRASLANNSELGIGTSRSETKTPASRWSRCSSGKPSFTEKMSWTPSGEYLRSPVKTPKPTEISEVESTLLTIPLSLNGSRPAWSMQSWRQSESPLTQTATTIPRRSTVPNSSKSTFSLKNRRTLNSHRWVDKIIPPEEKTRIESHPGSPIRQASS